MAEQEAVVVSALESLSKVISTHSDKIGSALKKLDSIGVNASASVAVIGELLEKLKVAIGELPIDQTAEFADTARKLLEAAKALEIEVGDWDERLPSGEDIQKIKGTVMSLIETVLEALAALSQG